MDVTSDEIRSSRFQGTRHVYDRREVDAFLHRAASTLELYERKLAVTESHVQSLEKALDLANSRVRSVRERDARISELETALAAAQHHYELEVERTENSVTPVPAIPNDSGTHEAAARRSEELVDVARQEAEEIRTRAVDYTEQASDEATEILAASRAEAAGLIEEAKSQETAMLKELAAARAEAEAKLEAELLAKRAALSDEVAANSERLAGMEAVAFAEMDVKLQNAEKRAAKIASKSQQIIQQAEERARAAETERDELAAELKQEALAAEARRNKMMADVELMVGEAVTQAEVDRDLMLLEAQVRVEAAESESVALIQQTQAETAQMTAAAEAKLESLRRQAAQMRTALSSLHQRFADVGSVTAEDFELATALVDLDLHDVGEVVDLTREEAAPEQPPAESGAVVPIKSKWAQPATAAPRGVAIDRETADPDTQEDVLEEAPKASANGDHHPTWRDKVAPPRPAEAPDEDVKQSLGFYERRLAGLRARLQEAMPDEY